MATYVIGDVQGCFKALKKLIKKIDFKPQKDKIIFCGDLVNRGGESLDVLRWVYKHKKNCQVVLGNHDLALLAQYYVPKFRKKNNLEFKRIFQAHDCNNLMDWLRTQKILIDIKKFNKVIVHAGINPIWTLKKAKKEALYLEKILLNNHLKFFNKMYGTKPNHWSKSLIGMDRARFIVNSFTRMRFLYKNGGLNFKAKGEVVNFPRLIPWFKYENKKRIKSQIIFGHWSALGLMIRNDIICLDTGKVWGGKLTALKLSKKFKKSKHIIQI